MISNFLCLNLLQKKIRIIFFGLLAFCLSCVHEDKTVVHSKPSFITIDTNTVSYYANIDSVIDNIQFVPLESSKEAIIGSIEKICILEDRLIVFQKNGLNSVYIFDKQGKLTKILSSPGGNIISDLGVQDHKIYLFLNLKKSLEVFDREGVHLESIPLNPDLLSSSIEVMPGNNIVTWNNTQSTKVGNYKILCFNDYRSLQSGFLQFSFQATTNMNLVNPSPFDKLDDNNIMVSQPLDDTVRCLNIYHDKYVLYPKYILKFQSNPLPSGYLNRNDIYNSAKDASQKNYSYFSGSFLDMDSVIYFSYTATNNRFAYLLSKRHGLIANSVEMRSKKFDLPFPSPSRKIWRVGNNSIVGFFYAYELLDWAGTHKGLKSAKKLLELCSHLSRLDNPVLYFIEFK